MENDYLITRKPIKALISFSLPMIIGNLFQQFYTMADSAIVGRFVGEQALAAVGASYALTNIFICIAIGGGIGSSVIISKYFGGKDYQNMKTAINTAMLSFLLISVLLAGVGLIFNKKIMILLNTPNDTLDMAVVYLNIYFLGLPFLFMYNVISSMFNACGKSKIPLYFLIFSSILNVFLDLFMVSTLQMGVAGAAWATLISQGIAAIFSFIVLLRYLQQFSSKDSKAFSKIEFTSMIKIAIPSILQQSIVSIGMMLVQSVINSFGSGALAGFSAAMRIESICVVPMAAIGNAVSSFTAQNIGADQKERVIEGFHAANKMVIFCGVILCLTLEFFNLWIIEFFLGTNGTEAALSTGRDYLSFMGWFYFMIGFKMVVDGLLRGAGDMKMFTVANLVNLFIRVAVSILLAPHFGISMVWVSVPIGWFMNWLISFGQYRTGHWKALTLTAKT
ncbi:MAG: MATE family efflux transporter [Oscillospiraceae bacterium]|jgi:putative MATE family efflux protein|nr:Multidrug export protein MepA [Ruminococcaceae bacterium BL-4]